MKSNLTVILFLLAGLAVVAVISVGCAPHTPTTFEKAPANVEIAVAKYTVIVSYNGATNYLDSKKYQLTEYPSTTSSGIVFHDANGKLVMASNYLVIEN
jgi:hypothetical protein